MGINRARPIDYRLRLSKDMHQWLKDSAASNYRTMMDEINMHLEQARERIEKQAGTKKADDTVESNSSASTKSHAKGI